MRFIKSKNLVLLLASIGLATCYATAVVSQARAATEQESSVSASSSAKDNENKSSKENSSSGSSGESTQDLFDKKGLAATAIEKKGSTVKFVIDFQFPQNEKEYKQLVLTDPLEMPFRYQKSIVKAESDGKWQDITNQGKLELNKDTNVLTFTFTNGNNYWGQKVRWEIETQIDKNADLAKYQDKDGKFWIPNVASYDTGNSKETSKTVKVNVPADPQTVPDKADPLPDTGLYNWANRTAFLVGITLGSIGIVSFFGISWYIDKKSSRK